MHARRTAARQVQRTSFGLTAGGFVVAMGPTTTAAGGRQVRHAGQEFLAQKAQSDTRSLSERMVQKRSEKNALAARENVEIMNTLSETEAGNEIKFRKEDRPWEIVPQFVKRRVVDMVGILTSAHRMEMEQAIQKIRPICDIDMYVVIVPTVGYVTPRAFAKSIFFDWGIGEPRGNGVLLVLSQKEAAVQVISSPAINEHFGQTFVDLLVREVMQPLLKDGKASYAMVQATYAVARHAQESRHAWQSDLVPLPVKNKIRFAEQVAYYGAVETWNFWGAIALIVASVYVWRSILELMCPECGEWMCRVDDEALIGKILDPGQRVEWENGCTQFFVQRCPKCKHDVVKVTLRDMYNDSRCLKCEDCHYHTVSKTTDVIRLATKKEDGLKRETYACQFCRVGREVDLPLYRPIDTKPDEDSQWYSSLLDRAADPRSGRKQSKLV